MGELSFESIKVVFPIVGVLLAMMLAMAYRKHPPGVGFRGKKIPPAHSTPHPSHESDRYVKVFYERLRARGWEPGDRAVFRDKNGQMWIFLRPHDDGIVMEKVLNNQHRVRPAQEHIMRWDEVAVRDFVYIGLSHFPEGNIGG